MLPYIRTETADSIAVYAVVMICAVGFAAIPLLAGVFGAVALEATEPLPQALASTATPAHTTARPAARV